MFYYLKGTCTFIDKANIVLDVSNIGYEILVSKPNDFHIGQEYTIFAYLVIREDQQYLIGFSSLEERKLFLTLIEVKGIGPKTAINILGSCTPEMLLKAISNQDIAYLKKLPGVGGKAASQIILDLKDKLIDIKAIKYKYENVRLALRKLGYKNSLIENVLSNMNVENESDEKVLTLALKQLRKH